MEDCPDPLFAQVPSPKILVVDDASLNIRMLSAVLSSHGYEIQATTSGHEALEILEEQRPDLILLDYLMPGLDGLVVCRAIKARPETADIPVIFLTVNTEIDNIVEAFKAGAVDYLTKPFNPEELLARVNTHVQLKRARDREKALIEELQSALTQIKQLKGLIPICASCKKIRDDTGYWNQVEEYITTRTEAVFSHGICPDCMERDFPEVMAQRRARQGN